MTLAKLNKVKNFASESAVGIRNANRARADGRSSADDAFLPPEGRQEQSMSNSMVRRNAVIRLGALATILTLAVPVATQPRALAITGVNVVDVVNGRIVPSSTV